MFIYIEVVKTEYFVVVVALLFYVHGIAGAN